MRKLLWIALPTLALAACSKPEPSATSAMNAAGNNQSAMTMLPEAPMPAADTLSYLAKAGAGDLFEIESSRAILKTTQNAGIKDFANMMIRQHGQSTEKVKAAAVKAGLTVSPPKLTPDQQQKLNGIKAANGAAADNAYLDAQRGAHAEALALHQGYSENGDTAPLKTVAGEIAAVVQHHIDALGKLSTQ